MKKNFHPDYEAFIKPNFAINDFRLYTLGSHNNRTISQPDVLKILLDIQNSYPSEVMPSDRNDLGDVIAMHKRFFLPALDHRGPSIISVKLMEYS